MEPGDLGCYGNTWEEHLTPPREDQRRWLEEGTSLLVSWGGKRRQVVKETRMGRRRQRYLEQKTESRKTEAINRAF